MSSFPALSRAKAHPQWGAFRSFCDLARRPQRRTSKFERADWGQLPRVGPFLPNSDERPTPDAWIQASRHFLERATRALLEDLDPAQKRSCPVWVVRKNNVDGEKLDGMQGEVLDPHGRPYGIEQIKKMKQLGVAELFLWAQNPLPGADSERARAEDLP